ncbi:hypothetical protein MTO96_029113 [Rhipicephalus appendiculatus]
MAVPVLYPSPQGDSKAPTSPGRVKTPPATVQTSFFSATDVRRTSSRTHSKTNIKVRSPLLSPGQELSRPALARRPATSPRRVSEQLSSVVSPLEVVSPPGTRVGYSFDSDQSEPYAVEEIRPWWQLMWMLCSVVFITVLIPVIVFLMSYQRTGHVPPAVPVVPVVTTSENVTSSTSTTLQTTTGLQRVTFDPEEGFLLPPGETLQDFCDRQMEPDQSPMPPPGRLPSTMPPNSSINDIQLRPVICVFNAKYWRLQDAYLPTLMPLHYCSAILWYGYAVDAVKGAIVWKYPTANRYLNALLYMKFQRQLLHRGNDISVYFALGGAHEDSANLSYVAGNPWHTYTIGAVSVG